MESKIVIFEGNKEDGIFSNKKKFYPENYTEKDIFESIKNDRIKLGKKFGFSGLKMFQVTQKMEDNNSYPDNLAVEIEDNLLKKADYFEEKIKADILVIREKYKGIVLCHRMADCPVLIAEDRKEGISAIVHCGIYHVNRGLPREFIKTLVNAYHCKPENIYLYIGSHIKKESYIYDQYPKHATNPQNWENAIIEEKDGFHIDMETAIKNQIKEYPLAEIKVSPVDTAKDDRYASHREVAFGNMNKLGQNIVGFYYK